MNGGTKTTTQKTETKNDPYAAAVPGLQRIADGANAAYDSGVGSQVYGGQRVAGLGQTTQSGMDAMKAAAGGTTGATQAGIGLVGDLLKSGGSTEATRSAVSGLMGVPTVDTSGVASAASRMADPNGTAATVGKGLASGAYALDGSGYKGLLDEVGSTTQTQRSLQAVADGAYLGGANPYLDDIIGRAGGEAASAVGQKFAGSGRYGSGRFAAATADAVANVETKARYADYENERARQAQAAGQIDSAGNALTGIRSGLLGAMNDVRTANAGQAVTGANLASGADAAALTGATTLAGLEQANNTQRLNQAGTALSSAQGDRAAALGSLSQIPGLQDQMLQPGRTLASVGAVEDEARQKELAAAQDVFAEGQSAPWQRLGLLSQLTLPVAAAGSTTNSTVTAKQPAPSMLSQILGGISSGVGILGQTGAFGAPAAAGAAGSAAAGAGGWLSSALPSLLALSDERAKEDVTPVGSLNDGQTVYSYRYKGDPTPQIGLLAQEVAQAAPDAVALMPGAHGLLGVDYARATARSARMGLQGAGDTSKPFGR